MILLPSDQSTNVQRQLVYTFYFIVATDKLVLFGRNYDHFNEIVGILSFYLIKILNYW